MAEFFEVPVGREDGSEGFHFVNIEAISYIDFDAAPAKTTLDSVKIYLNNGYWFTLSGPKAAEVIGLIKGRVCAFRKAPEPSSQTESP